MLFNMVSKLLHVSLLVATALLFSSCENNATRDTRVLAAANAHSELLENKPCRAFGFRNWSIQRTKKTVKISGEARLPTPAWSMELHQNLSEDNRAIQLVMETIDPPGLSTSVISWVYFESTVTTLRPELIKVTVLCAGDLVWASEGGTTE